MKEFKKVSIRSIFESCGLEVHNLKIKTPFLDATINLSSKDREAAWEMYVELVTRVTTQNLEKDHGDEASALNSVHQIFSITREILKLKGRQCHEFTKIAVIVLNKIIRPFTSKWHKENISGAFKDSKKCKIFRKELLEIQEKVCNYTKVLAVLAEVDDITEVIN